MALNREYVMLAQTFNPDHHKIGGWFMSIKLDGQRCFWDGGISIGVPKRQIPWANNNRDERYQEPPIATGLWTRYGNTINAPSWFINSLPKGIMLDGELYLGRGRFQETRKIISTIVPGSGWSEVKYHVFDMPSPNTFFQNGQITNRNNKIFITEDDCWRYYRDQPRVELTPNPGNLVYPFTKSIRLMQELTKYQGYGGAWQLCEQIRLPENEDEAKEVLYKALELETNLGGEGVMLRSPTSIWVPVRSSNELKVKSFEDDEAIVMGFVNGYGRLRGAMGALVIAYKNKEFQIGTGFNDDERCYESDEARLYAYNNEGTLMIGPHNCVHFKRGERVRFRYRGLTDDGLPREARYFR